jgi:hypothetical protein
MIVFKNVLNYETVGPLIKEIDEVLTEEGREGVPSLYFSSPGGEPACATILADYINQNKIPVVFADEISSAGFLFFLQVEDCTVLYTAWGIAHNPTVNYEEILTSVGSKSYGWRKESRRILKPLMQLLEAPMIACGREKDLKRLRRGEDIFLSAEELSVIKFKDKE